MTRRETMLLFPEFFSKEEYEQEFPNGVHSRVNQFALSTLGAVAAILVLGVVLGLLTGRI